MAALSSFQHCRPLIRGTRSVGVDYSNEDNNNGYVKRREAQCYNILHSTETLGKAITDLVIEPKDASIFVDFILQEVTKGESWFQ
ncbi:hypothetical protein L6452_01296 [Arctium lappa]|uniref:Uncharacterized protein n=1 Tax=Arctium lappa TaxID=4217 RepID=A0ACB9FGX2_ARCLA|nr:hypothetical protein L6452_01296 [Arctium lappa]